MYNKLCDTNSFITKSAMIFLTLIFIMLFFKYSYLMDAFVSSLYVALCCID